MPYAPTFHETATGITNASPMTNIGTATTTGSFVENGPRVVLIGSIADFYLNYGSSSTATRFYVETSAMPFQIAVDDMNELYAQSTSGTAVNLFIMSYPVNTLIP
jgi:hypothetical protein